ncbi:HlyD family secretion protein [Mucilaginibacter mallensis]|uniref:HlyD family secretion protein n=1 Tax=Mucilaginibacter mallensis TaxID=652787 RepID=A0A1H1YVD5_MUCMA|nr:HlyD family efflux transporter periplasmic adaptor subunit [Mucilaginibacter mallensis]SDT25434.1 HlyD family secretion protein [Mucilaginibacter mallensis]
MLISISQISNTTINYLPAFRKRSYILYWIILLMVITTLVTLPLIHITIAVTAQGITRPIRERTDVKTVIGGIIDSVYYHEGSTIKKGATLLRIKDAVTKGKKLLNNYEISQHTQCIHDLQLLTTHQLNESIISQLYSPLYKEQLSHYLHQKTDQDASLKKNTQEYNTDAVLLKGKVITNKEFFDAQIAYEKATANAKAFEVEQQSSWQQDLVRYNLELSQYKEEQDEVNIDASYFEVKAPVSGTLQGINTLYTGGLLQSNETLCTISPDGSLIAECYVSTKDIGLIKQGQSVRFQIDAFDYNYFGALTGKVISVDNDFTTLNGNIIFKVRCRFDSTQLHLKNGYAGNLQKGLTFQARFIIGDRTLWQLLWDNINNWLNPAAPQHTT